MLKSNSITPYALITPIFYCQSKSQSHSTKLAISISGLTPYKSTFLTKFFNFKPLDFSLSIYFFNYMTSALLFTFLRLSNARVTYRINFSNCHILKLFFS